MFSHDHMMIVKVKVKADIALHGNSISELREVTRHMGSHSVTCHPTQVHAPRLIPAMQAGTRFSSVAGEKIFFVAPSHASSFLFWLKCCTYVFIY